MVCKNFKKGQCLKGKGNCTMEQGPGCRTRDFFLFSEKGNSTKPGSSGSSWCLTADPGEGLSKMTGKGPSRIRKREGRGNRAQGEAGAGTAFTSDPGTRGPPSGAFLSSLLWIIHVQAPVKVLAAQSCLTLTPWTVACQAPLSRGFSRQEYWSGLPFPSPGHHPNPEIEPESPAWRANSLLPESPGKPIKYLHSINAKIWDMDKRMI